MDQTLAMHLSAGRSQSVAGIEPAGSECLLSGHPPMGIRPAYRFEAIPQTRFFKNPTASSAAINQPLDFFAENYRGNLAIHL